MTRQIILQGFNWASHTHKRWNYNLKNMAKYYSDSKVTKLWLPPLSKSHGDEGYFPDDYYNFDSKYGTSKDLWELVDECNKYDIEPIGEIISWTCLPKFCREKFNFGGQLINADDDEKWERLIEWAHFINKKGIKGYRIDMAKEVPYEVLKNLPSDSFIMSEVWESMNYDFEYLLYDQYFHRKGLVDYIDSTNYRTHAFDFTLKGILQESLLHDDYWRLTDKENRPFSLNGVLPNNSITFIDNHDTQGQKMWPFQKHVIEGYAYLLFHDGIPCIYFDHFNYILEKLIDVTMDMDMNENIEIIAADINGYIAKRGKYYFQLGYHQVKYGKTIFEYGKCSIQEE